MVATTALFGAIMMLANVYAPTDRIEREQLFSSIGQYVSGHAGPLLMGGDINCTIHPSVDRTNPTTAADKIPAELHRLAEQLGLVDTHEREVTHAAD